MTMDPAVPRSIAKLQYAAARLPFTLLDEFVVTRFYGPNAPVRVGFERWLGSLDLLVGRLLADDEISLRGLALTRPTGEPALGGGPAMDVPVQSAWSGQVAPDTQDDDHAPEILPAAGQAPEMRDQIAPYQKQDDVQQGQQAADGQVTTGNAPPSADEVPVSGAAGEAGQLGTPDTPAARAGAVDVTFTLPTEVHADTVALVGEFNDWSAEDAQLERDSDGSWRATVALEPGRSYRYRYLLDGQRWENDRRADRYEPNALGSTDSVVVVE
jgi:Carbohydrate-binding module 48 (Isoamylase N-terminal domain)